MYATSEHVRLLKRESRQRIKVRDALSVTQAATARLDAVQYLPLAPVPGTSYPGCVLPPHLPLDPVPGTSYPGCMLPPPLWNAPVWTTSYAYGVMPPWHEVPLLLPAPEVQPVVPTHGTSHTTYAHPSQTAAPAAQEAPAASPATATTMVETPAAAGVPETPAPEDDPPYLSIAPFGVRALPVSADRVFPPDQAPGLIAPAFQRIWACALEYGLDPMNNTGKLRGGDEAVQRRLHERLAQAHLGLKGGEKMQQCGALHGGFTAMGGSNPRQRMERMVSKITGKYSASKKHGCEDVTDLVRGSLVFKTPSAIHNFLQRLNGTFMGWAPCTVDAEQTECAGGDLPLGLGKIQIAGMKNRMHLTWTPCSEAVCDDDANSHNCPAGCEDVGYRDVLVNVRMYRDATGCDSGAPTCDFHVAELQLHLSMLKEPSLLCPPRGAAQLGSIASSGRACLPCYLPCCCHAGSWLLCPSEKSTQTARSEASGA